LMFLFMRYLDVWMVDYNKSAWNRLNYSFQIFQPSFHGSTKIRVVLACDEDHCFYWSGNRENRSLQMSPEAARGVCPGMRTRVFTHGLNMDSRQRKAFVLSLPGPEGEPYPFFAWRAEHGTTIHVRSDDTYRTKEDSPGDRAAHPGDIRPGRELHDGPPVPPGNFFSLIDSGMHGLIEISAIRAGIGTGIFRELEQSRSLPDLSGSLGIREELLEPFCDLLCSMGLLRKEDGFYHNSGVASTFLFDGSPYSQISYLEKTSRMVENIWEHLPRILRQGPFSFTREEFFDTLVLPSMAENALTGRLQRTVRAISDLPGFTSFRKMIDLGGGHGLYAIALSGENPDLSAIVFDLPGVIPLADDYIRRYHAGNVRTVGGDFFRDDIGGGYDLVFSSSNPSGKSIGVLDKIRAALNTGGYFVNVQSDDEGNRDPYSALEWQLWTIDNRSKATFTKEMPFLTPEYRAALESHGLSVISEEKIRDDYHPDATVTMIIARKNEQ